MKVFFTTISILLYSCLFSQTIQPEVLSSSGDFYSNSSAQLSFTFGEMIVETVSSSSNIITQGFQQPEQESVGIEETKNQLHVVLYPNPSKELLNIDLSEKEFEINLTIYDATGKVIKQQYIPSWQQKVTLNINSFSSGYYIMTLVSSDNQYQSSYKLQKID